MASLFLGGATGGPVLLHALGGGFAGRGGHAALPAGGGAVLGCLDFGPAGTLGGGDGSPACGRELAAASVPCSGRPGRRPRRAPTRPPAPINAWTAAISVRSSSRRACAPRRRAKAVTCRPSPASHDDNARDRFSPNDRASGGAIGYDTVHRWRAA